MFLRRLFGIEVSRSFDVSEEGIEGVLTPINPDCPHRLEQIERERLSREQATSSTRKKVNMATVALTGDDGVYAEVGGAGVDNPGFEADASASPAAAVSGVLVNDTSADADKTDENQNFYANLATDGPAALDPAVKVDDAVDPGAKAVHGEMAGDNDFPGEDFWAGCRSMDLKEWVESVKSQPPDKVKPCVLNSSLPDRLKLPASKKFVDIIDPVIRDGRVQAQPPAGSFSYIKTSDEPRVPEQGSPVSCNECLTKANCCPNLDKGRMNNWFWIGLAIFLVTIIIIIAIVVGVRGADS